MSLEPGIWRPIAPEIKPQLREIILDVALLDDATGYPPSMQDYEKYVAAGALRVQEFVIQELQTAAITLSEAQLTLLCRNTMSEVYIIRRVVEGPVAGEICKQDIRAGPFYKPYQAYFDLKPEMLARGLTLALDAMAHAQQQVKQTEHSPQTPQQSYAQIQKTNQNPETESQT